MKRIMDAMANAAAANVVPHKPSHKSVEYVVPSDSHKSRDSGNAIK
jgi:hypothetical protein